MRPGLLLLLPKPDMEEARRLMEGPIILAPLRNRDMCTFIVPLALPTQHCQHPRSMSSQAHTAAEGDRYRSKAIHLNRDMKVTTFSKEGAAITKSLMAKVREVVDT